MIAHRRLVLSAVILQIALVSTALAETDKKILSGAACQAQDPKERDKLKYFARGVQAFDQDVDITCPIIRDSTGTQGINWIDVRYQRGFNIPPQGSDKDQFMGDFTGSLWSCSNVAAGNAECKGIDGQSHGHPDTTRPTSVHIETKGLPHDENRYYVYKTTLPKFAILKSITYQERVD
jgi:hypothetical protein